MATTRRSLLAAVGTGTMVGTAGCSVLSGGGDERDTWSEGGPPDRDGWEATFQDDFTTGELDRSIWSSGFG